MFSATADIGVFGSVVLHATAAVEVRLLGRSCNVIPWIYKNELRVYSTYTSCFAVYLHDVDALRIDTVVDIRLASGWRTHCTCGHGKGI